MSALNFDAGMYPNHIALVGAGGTGAQWARMIARMLYDMRARGLHAPSFTIFDPDRVERKNVGRQPFSPADVGSFKAEILAQRLGMALGLEIEAITTAFDSSHLSYSLRTLLCGAVDGHEGRAAMHKVFAGGWLSKCIWIDAGNFRVSGQVIIGNATRVTMTDIAKSKKKQLKEPESSIIAFLPVATALFPTLLEPDPEEAPAQDASCAEMVAQGDQALLVNDLMATVAASYTYKILHRQPITSFITFVDIDLLSVRSLPITQENLEAYLEPIPEIRTGPEQAPADPLDRRRAAAMGYDDEDEPDDDAGWPARQMEGDDAAEGWDE